MSELAPPPPPKPTAKAPRPVIALPVKRELRPWDLDNLRASGLNDDTIAQAQLYTELVPIQIAALLGMRVWPRARGSALVIPFFFPGASEPHAYRVRPRQPRTNKRGRAVKYEQPQDSPSLVYFPPRARAGGAAGPLRDMGATLHWTEGEKKALALDQLGHACVGLTGVNLWHDVNLLDETGEWRLHPTLVEHVQVAGRNHVIVFDADARNNDHVMRAAQQLCGVLLAAGAISVRLALPPNTEQKGIDDYYAAHGGEAVRSLLDGAERLEPLDPASPMQHLVKLRALREAPIAHTLRLPQHYEVQRDGSIWYQAPADKKAVLVSHRPILLARLLEDLVTAEGRAEVAYVSDGAWVTACVSRRAVVDIRAAVVELGAVGAPVTSGTAGRVIDWFDASLAANDTRVPRVACVSGTGWATVEGRRVFVANAVLVAEQPPPAIALDTRGGRGRMFAALKPRGTLEAHLAALQAAYAADPVCAAMILTALAAPLLEPLGAPNFATHLAGDSTRGKTTMLKIAASVYGDPESEWVASWNTTPVAAELRAAAWNHLPQCYDELGAGGDAAAAEKLLYQLINGMGRTRGRADLSTREVPTWCCTFLSTGERALAGGDASTGAQVRCVQLPVAGFGQLGADDIDALRRACGANAGSFGHDWLGSLLLVDDWAPWRRRWAEQTAAMRGLAAGDPLAGRVASYFGVLAVAEELASNYGLGKQDGGTVLALFAAADKREAVQPLADRALALARDWVLSEPDSFPELRQDSGGNSSAPPDRGRQRAGFRADDGTIYFIPSAFSAWCAEHRLYEREVLRQWRDRGWLQLDSGSTRKRLTKQVRLGSNRVQVVALAYAPPPDDAQLT